MSLNRADFDGGSWQDSAAGLPGNSDEVRGLSTKPTELGELVLYYCLLPQHLWLQEAILWPRVQEVEPL